MRARRRSLLSPLGLAFLCGHCVLGGALAVAGALGLATLPSVLGVSLAWVLPPVVVLGAFGAWLWSGRGNTTPSDAVACRKP